MFSGHFKNIPPYLHMLQHVFRSFQEYLTLPPHAPACFQVISRISLPYLHMLQHVFRSQQNEFILVYQGLGQVHIYEQRKSPPSTLSPIMCPPLQGRRDVRTRLREMSYEILLC
jgi:hypothetical protein